MIHVTNWQVSEALSRRDQYRELVVSIINHLNATPLLSYAQCFWHLNCCFLFGNCISIQKKKTGGCLVTLVNQRYMLVSLPSPMFLFQGLYLLENFQ